MADDKVADGPVLPPATGRLSDDLAAFMAAFGAHPVPIVSEAGKYPSVMVTKNPSDGESTVRIDGWTLDTATARALAAALAADKSVSTLWYAAIACGLGVLSFCPFADLATPSSPACGGLACTRRRWTSWRRRFPAQPSGAAWENTTAQAH